MNTINMGSNPKLEKLNNYFLQRDEMTEITFWTDNTELFNR